MADRMSYKDALQGKLNKPHVTDIPAQRSFMINKPHVTPVDDIPAHRFITREEMMQTPYAEGQITVRQHKTGGYDGLLNDEGLQMWHKMLIQQPTGVIANAVLIPSRTGVGIYSGDISWNNRKIQGVLHKNISMAGRFVEGDPVTTSAIVLMKVDERGNGRAITFSGSVYELIGPL